MEPGKQFVCPAAQCVGLTFRMTRLLTAQEVAEHLGVTTAWVWAQTRAGRIPHVQLGRYRHFREEAFEEWVRRLEETNVKR